jgi:hypothetical protein
VFGRYWDEHDGQINHQLFAATLASDGADVVAVGPLHRSESGNNPYIASFSPDGTTILIRPTTGGSLLAAPASGGTF